jgi:molybdate transport system substrate-binding protein
MKQRRSFWTLLAFSVVAATLWGTQPVQAQPEPLAIAAANSLKDVLRKVLPVFEAQHREIDVRVIYGPSQTLRDQITQGALVDVFLPSLIEEIDQLKKKGSLFKARSAPMPARRWS